MGINKYIAFSTFDGSISEAAWTIIGYKTGVP
jgi:hypothetical protein